jgi:hypothetical protein
MATVLDLVTEALVTVKALAVGEPIPPSMSNNALNKFNDVLEALSIQNLAVYSTLQTTFPLVAGTASYTIGPTGAVVAQRPPFLDTAFVTYQGTDFPVDVHTDDEYALIGLKSQRGIPQWLIYDPAYPNGVMILWPVPDQAATMTIYQNTVFTAATSLLNTFAMPPGYRRMIRLLLAWELVTDYPGMSQSDIAKLAEDTKGAVALVKRNNKKPELLRSEVAALDCSGGGDTSNWRDGA